MPDPLPTAPTDPLALVLRVDQARHDGAQAPAATARRRDRAGGQHGVRWCAAHALQALPATPQTLVLSRTARAEQITPGTLASRVAASRCAHQPRGHASPTTHPLVCDVLSGIRRTRGTRPMQVHGLIRDLLTRLLQATGDSRRDRRTRALLAVAYARLARRSALIALVVEDLEHAPDAAPRCSAAAQLIPRARAPPLSRARTQGGRVRARLSADAMSRLFTPMAQAAGLAPALVQGLAGHRARVRAAQDMAVHGLALAGIMPAGRWKTPQRAGRSSERLTARRGAAARLAARQHRLEAAPTA